jgi:UDP-GlcNAc:undecaprenyl-phosphate GlcNAc-1-phosphate transferase
MTLLFSSAFFITLLAVVGLRPIAENIGLVDRPNTRKQHLGNIPLVGGVAIYIAVLFVVKLLVPDSQLLTLYLISCSFMVFIGALDDFYDLNARVRLLAQFFIATILVFGADFSLHNLGNLFGLGSVQLGFLSIPFTLLAVPTAINAFNMTDGIDGLVGCLGIVTFSCLGVLTFWTGNSELFAIAIAFVAALTAFLLFNLGGLRRAFGRVFMGDAGSMMIGLSVIWLLVLGTQGDSGFRPVTALWIIAIPLLDMFSVMHRRLKKGQSPLMADRDHLHHIMIRLGLSHRKALATISLLAAIFGMFGLVGEYFGFPEFLMLILFIVLAIVYDLFFIHIWKVSKFIKGTN